MDNDRRMQEEARTGGARLGDARLDDLRLGSSYRDPSGFVFLRNGELFRQVNDGYRADYESDFKSANPFEKRANTSSPKWEASANLCRCMLRISILLARVYQRR